MNIEKLNPNKFQFKALSFEKDETGWCVTLLETESQMKFYIDVWYATRDGKRDSYLTLDWNQHIFRAKLEEDAARQGFQGSSDVFMEATSTARYFLESMLEIYSLPDDTDLQLPGISIDVAKKALEMKGYFTENLYHESDVQNVFPQVKDKELLQAILKNALTGEYISESAHDMIKVAGKELGLKPKE